MNNNVYILLHNDGPNISKRLNGLVGEIYPTKNKNKMEGIKLSSLTDACVNKTDVTKITEMCIINNENNKL